DIAPRVVPLYDQL
ncbi:hypothetical protein CICLE_v100223493mg, partial [Citrus x clementina]